MNTRILSICDLRATPYTVGELLWFQGFTQMLRARHEVDKTDVAWLCDPSQPGRPDQKLTPDNYHHYLAPLLPLAQVNKHLGSFFLFDSSSELQRYVDSSRTRYQAIEPDLTDYTEPKRTYLDWYSEICRFYQQHGFLPGLHCRPATLLAVRRFLAEQVRPRLPITVHLRRHAFWSTERNALPDSWFEFFEYCSLRHPVVFLLIGSRGEIDPAFRRLDNVLFSKDFLGTVEEDMALIESSLLYMGSTSGPAVMAVLNRTPYLIFNYRASHTRLETGSQFPFAGPLQQLMWEPESCGLLQETFERTLDCLDIQAWEQEFEERARDSDQRLARDLR